MLIPVLLSGGVGSRLWPVSRELFPKQFLPLVDREHSLLQDTLRRTRTLSEQGESILICNEEHRFMVAEQLRQLEAAATIMLEPAGRNTAPAVALAALQAQRQDPQALLLVLPADHVITDEALFARAVEQGSALAADGYLVTFGIVPDQPETGYGYIQCGEPLGDESGAARIARFVEKPPREQAEAYLASGDYLWNSGMFLLRADLYLQELAEYAPAILEHCQAAWEASQLDMDFIRIDRERFAQCPNDSIDYALMEHTQRGAVIPLASGWSDVGAWSTLWKVGDKDEHGNVSSGDVLTSDVTDSYLRSESRLVAAVGVDDVVVVETADAVLVSRKDRVQDVKAIVSQLQAQGRSEASTHKRVYRPWGFYESLVEDGRFQVKRIQVNPGERLSLQMHHHRAEHWIVVKGTAEVTNDDQVFLLSEDQSTYIPLGHQHQLANPGVIPLEIIEVQTGSYLGEDDIVRFRDQYGRSAQK